MSEGPIIVWLRQDLRTMDQPALAEAAASEKFDAGGAYIRRWVPELARLPDRWIHHPWEAPPLDLEAASVRLGRDYPQRVIDHGEARQRALRAFASLGDRE